MCARQARNRFGCISKKPHKKSQKMMFRSVLSCFLKKKNVKVQQGQPVKGTVKGMATDPLRIPVEVNDPLRFTQCKSLVDEGFTTDGQTVTLANKLYMWYEKYDTYEKKHDTYERKHDTNEKKYEIASDKVPCNMESDHRAEYFWVCRSYKDDEFTKLQSQGWLARTRCLSGDLVWLCKKKTLPFDDDKAPVVYIK